MTLSLGLNSQPLRIKKKALGVSGVPEPTVYIDPLNTSSLEFSGGNVSKLNDVTGNQNNLVAGDSNISRNADGSLSITNGATEYLVEEKTAELYDSMHNTSGKGTALMIWSSSFVGNMTLATTADLLGGNVGRGFRFDFFNASSTERMAYFFGNGTAGRGIASQNNFSPAGQINITAIRKQPTGGIQFRDFWLYSNGSVDDGSANSMASNHNFTPSDTTSNKLHLFKHPNVTSGVGSANFYGWLYWDGIDLTQPQIDAVKRKIQRKIDGISLITRSIVNLVRSHGQSKMLGSVAPISESSTYSTNDLIADSDIFKHTTETFVPLQVGVNNADGVNATTNFSPNVGIMDEIQSRSSEKWYNIQFAVGGTPMEDFILGGLYYETLQERTYRAIEELERLGNDVRQYLALWHGTSDADTLIKANDYLNKLIQFYSEAKENSRGYDIIRMAIVDCQTTDGAYPYVNIVNQAISDFVDLCPENRLLIDRIQTNNPDNIHPITDSSEQVGRDIGAYLYDGTVRNS